MAGNRGRRPQERQHIDKAKQLYLDRLVTHAPCHEAVVPPRRQKGHRAAAIQACEISRPSTSRLARFRCLSILGNRHATVPETSEVCIACNAANGRIPLAAESLQCTRRRTPASSRAAILTHSCFHSGHFSRKIKVPVASFPSHGIAVVPIKRGLSPVQDGLSSAGRDAQPKAMHCNNPLCRHIFTVGAEAAAPAPPTPPPARTHRGGPPRKSSAAPSATSCCRPRKSPRRRQLRHCRSRGSSTKCPTFCGW